MIVFDLSRLIARAWRVTPTGIDRVEIAYAQHLIASGTALRFARVSLSGRRLALLPDAVAERYVGALAELWRQGPSVRRRGAVLRAALRLRIAAASCRRAFPTADGNGADRPVYLLVSHHHLENRSLVARLKRRHGMSFVCVIHDLIPIRLPEYARPGHDQRHRRRIQTAEALADAVIVPSAATAEELRGHIASRGGRMPRLLAAPFGVELPPTGAIAEPLVGRPYFVCLGTIEPRKNHLLLLNLWRTLLTQAGADPAALVLIGRRGWEIENTVDMLERCPGLRGVVFERNRLSDTEAVGLLKNARALLLPSYAEGFGFPLAEALACGTPALCSDIPALREIGGGVPEYLDPLDGKAWLAAIIDYAREPSPRRDAQILRLPKWRSPQWAEHFAAVDALLAELAAVRG